MNYLSFYEPIALLDRSSTFIIGFLYKAFAIALAELSRNKFLSFTFQEIPMHIETLN